MPISPRRLPGRERRHQLVQAAVELFAERDYGDVSLEDVAHAVGVAPSLLYHYFPGRVRELHLEAVRLACQQGVALLDIDAATPLPGRQATNFAAYLDEIQNCTPAYSLISRARASANPDVQAVITDARRELVSRIALNNLGTAEPAPAVALAIGSYLEFVEAACRQWEMSKPISRDELLGFLARTLTAVINSAETCATPA